MSDLIVKIKGRLKRRVKISTAIKIIVAVAVMAYLLNLVEVNKMATALKQANPYPILIAIALAPLNIVWLFFRWRYLIKYLDADRIVSNRQVLGSVLSGTTLRLTTPGGVGEFGRVFYIKGLVRTKLLALSIMDNLSAYIVSATVGSISLAYIAGRDFFLLIPIVLIALGITFRYLRHRIRFPSTRIIPESFRSSEFWEVVRDFPLSKFLVVLSMSGMMYAGFAIQFFLIVNAFESISIINGFAAISSIMFVKSSLPISIGDLGIRESASIFFFGKFGITKEAALDSSLLLFTFNLLIPAIIGSAFLTGLKLRSTEADKG
ncbi:MAG: hypothetical protein GF315_10605 [candidate division Zixibacteria bacterium]|nr:hypothetical protein [candidate division Zixibacteria bacterium]